MTGWCGGCDRRFYADELSPDHNGDPACGDCLELWAGLDDAGAWRWWAYGAA